MTTYNYAIEYLGYLHERIAATDTAIATLDMNATTMHYWSGGALEPIENAGMSAKYRVESVDVPDWLITGLSVKHDDAIDLAIKIVSGMPDYRRDFYEALRYMTIGKPGKFYRSLIEQFTASGELSPKQINAVINPPKWNRR